MVKYISKFYYTKSKYKFTKNYEVNNFKLNEIEGMWIKDLSLQAFDVSHLKPQSQEKIIKIK